MDFLTEIISLKRERLSRLKEQVFMEELRARAAALALDLHERGVDAVRGGAGHQPDQ